MNTLELITALNALLNLAADARINIEELQTARMRAEAEGRELSAEELRELSDKAREAVNQLPE